MTFLSTADTSGVPIRQQNAAESSKVDPTMISELARTARAGDADTGTVRPVRRGFMTRKLKASQRMLLLDDLSTMLNAGLNITDALTIVSTEMSNKTLKKALASIKQGIEIGRPFSEGLSLYPHMFPRIVVATVRVGEASGTLAETLGYLAEIARRESRLKKKIVGALMYPIVVLIAMIVVAVVMLTYVFPQIIAVFNESNIKLPLQIQAINWLGRVLSVYGLYIMLGVIATGIGISLLFRVKKIKLITDRMILKMPLVGRTLITGTILTRVSSNLRTMLVSGLPIVEGITIVAEATQNLEYRTALLKIAHEVETGRSLHDAFSARHHLFPSIVIRMVKVGEDTGKLDDVLHKLGVFYEEKVDDMMSNLSTILEPILLLVVGAVVGFIAISIIGPIYEIANNIT